ncbi:MAG TPA: hypothetical protein PKD68_04665, partial [Candidatus Saccharibacteria bacterium]|nr:hypothetical protein [Candidatus Saccharibacteria bacterium]
LAQDDARLRHAIDGETLAQLQERLIKKVKPLLGDQRVWVMKRAVAKRLLKAVPPKRLMKQLGYRSVDSMLKHEHIDELYVAIRFAESDTWLRSYNQQLRTLTPGDFESRTVSLVALSVHRYGSLARDYLAHRRYAIAHAKEMGIVALLPTENDTVTDGTALAAVVFMLHYINEVYLYSTFFKLKQVTPDFGDVLVRTLNDDAGSFSQIAGQDVHWRIVQRHLSSVDEQHPVLFRPHIQPEDLQMRATEKILVTLDPEMAFWSDMSYVGRRFDDSTVVSFNLLDGVLNYSNKLLLKKSSTRHFHDSVWNEIMLRYLGAKHLLERVMSQLDDGHVTV